MCDVDSFSQTSRLASVRLRGVCTVAPWIGRARVIGVNVNGCMIPCVPVIIKSRGRGTGEGGSWKLEE